MWNQTKEDNANCAVHIHHPKTGEKKILHDNEYGVWSCNITSLIWVDPNHVGKSKSLHTPFIDEISKSGTLMIYDEIDDSIGLKLLHLLVLVKEVNFDISLALTKEANPSEARQQAVSPVFFAGNIGRAPTHPGKDTGGVIIFQAAASLPVAGCFVFSALARRDPNLQAMLSGHDTFFHHCSSLEFFKDTLFNKPFGKWIDCKLVGKDGKKFATDLLLHINNNKRDTNESPLRFFHIEALRKVADDAIQKSDIAEKSLVAQHGLETIKRVKDYVRSSAPIHINLDLQRQIDKHDTPDGKPIKIRLIKMISVPRGKYLNQFDTGITGGSEKLDARRKWEQNMFGRIYNDTRNDSERPKYGTLNICNAVYGFKGVRHYGASHFILRNDVRLRCTVTSGDSSDEKSAKEAGTLDYCCHVLAQVKSRDKDTWDNLLKASNGDFSSEVEYSHYYVEAQIHGTVDINRDVQALFISKKDQAVLNLGSVREFQTCFPNVEIFLEGQSNAYKSSKVVISVSLDSTSSDYILLKDVVFS
eukprot:TRINITY_DN6857_c0_g1_i2.p1 TRINITY_DN6857_c0_g1~~TRINITY_DN6857_c0_g1_i2.p1  ORF type:complete len:530 (-),score=60.10 TRINITY_DN6857_c0_g1_i2:36-1625(-)